MQRGNYQQKVFHRDEDRNLYLDLLTEYSHHYGVTIEAYCLMSNHVHLIAVPHTPTSFARAFQRIHGDYARALHLRMRRVGHLWQGRYNSVAMDEEHFRAGMIYVEQNPVRAGLVSQPWNWKWSSALTHVTSVKNPLLDTVRWRARYTPEGWKDALSLGIQAADLQERIREGTQKGWPLGGAEFVEQIEADRGARAHPVPQGRKKASSAHLESETYEALAS